MKFDIVWNDILMVSWQIFVFHISDEHEIIFSELIAKPIKAHVHTFRSMLYNCVSDDTIGDTVV